MAGPHPSVALTRSTVRHALAQVPEGPVVVGVSGGADSLALAAAARFVGERTGRDVHAVSVDHQLQAGSDAVAEQAAAQCHDVLGYPADRVHVRAVHVPDGPAGLEANARTARYEALAEVSGQVGAVRVLVAHTGDDQAEQVLLAMLRGSGIRAIAGMRVDRAGVLRPFLVEPRFVKGAPVMRAHTVAACAALGLRPWKDPHNADPTFARVRARELLRSWEAAFPDAAITRNLVRTAALAGQDADYLDEAMETALEELTSGQPSAEDGGWDARTLAALPDAIRLRALRSLLVDHGARDSELAAHHLHDVDRLLTQWRGQGPIHVPGGVEVIRDGGRIAIRDLSGGQCS